MSATTVRSVSLSYCHKSCSELGMSFYMTTHFIDRMNLRAVNQDDAFTSLVRAVRFLLQRKGEFLNQRIYIRIGNNHFIIKPEPHRINCLTYFFNVEQAPVFADRHFMLKTNCKN